MKKVYYFIFLLFFLVGIFCYFFYNNLNNNERKYYIIINNKKINIELANTALARYQGLSNRENLEENNGMLFIFPEKQITSFCMRNMKFSLDMIWINDNTIIQIDKNLIPEGSAPKFNYYPQQPINYVLEVNGGFTDTNNIKVGDIVSYNF